MNIIIKKTLDVTEPLEAYIDEKLGALGKLVARFDEAQEGGLTLRFEVARSTMHHKKGEDIFTASGSLSLPHGDVRGEGSASDVRVAIDRVRDILREEIEKYKSKHEERYRSGKER
jgi:ribosomal subunit interface protein